MLPAAAQPQEPVEDNRKSYTIALREDHTNRIQVLFTKHALYVTNIDSLPTDLDTSFLKRPLALNKQNGVQIHYGIHAGEDIIKRVWELAVTLCEHANR